MPNAVLLNGTRRTRSNPRLLGFDLTVDSDFYEG